MKIKINSEDELKKIAEEAILILANLRKFTKLWKGTYGVELRNRKKCWEERADKLISELGDIELKTNEQIKIEINEATPRNQNGDL